MPCFFGHPRRQARFVGYSRACLPVRNGCRPGTGGTVPTPAASLVWRGAGDPFSGGNPVMTLRNFTLHRQGERETALCRSAGFDLNPEPVGIEVGAGLSVATESCASLASGLAECAGRGEAALIGGHTALWIGAV